MSAFTTEEKALIRRQAAEDRRRREAILMDRSTLPMDFSAPIPKLHDSGDQEDPLWKRIWKTEGIRWLGPRGDGVIDAMERFEHAFMLGYKRGVTDMRDAIQGGEA